MRYTAAFMERSLVVPLDEDDNRMVVGVPADPDGSAGARGELRRLLEAFHARTVQFTELPADELRVRRQRAASEAETVGASTDDPPFGVSIDDAVDDGPAVNLVNALLNDAVRERASDIHIEAAADRTVARYRIDGRLRTAERFVVASGARRFSPISARLKVMAGLNASQRHAPQDGRFTAVVSGDRFDVRVATMPTAAGESLVLRLFNRSEQALGLDALGLPDAVRAAIDALTRRQAGFLLASGPTGSGKTTTLHAVLRSVAGGDRKVVTIEDPVEYHVPEVDQIQTNDASGLSFPTLLARVLRHDPDIIMVGEIRDEHTARLAVRAAVTGHLVLSTVHARSGSRVRGRLCDLGVDPALLASVDPLVVSQRLVRTRCAACARDRSSGSACPLCGGSGYRGRTGLFELVTAAGTVHSLRADGRRKVTAGITTEEEVAWAISM